MRKWLGVGAALPLLLGSVNASASVNVQTFTPATGTSYVYSEDALMEVAPGDSTWTGERLYFHLMYNYDDKPLVEFDSTHTNRTNILVSSFNTMDLGAGILPLKNLMIAINFPITVVSQPFAGSQFAADDMNLHLKWRVTDDDAPLAIALVPTLYFPTGSQSLFLSNGSIGEGFSLAVERDFGPFRVAGNVGYRHNSNATYLDINYTNQIPMSLSAYIPIDNSWGVNLEGAGSLSVPISHYNNPGEIYAGGHYQATQDVSLVLGASIGTIGGGGSGDYRVIAGLKISPMDALTKKKEPVVAPAPRPVMAPSPVPSPKPVVRKPLVKKPLPKPSPTLSRKPVKKKPRKKKPGPKPSLGAPVGGNGPSGVDVETTTTVQTTTKVHVGQKPNSAPNSIRNSNPAPKPSAPAAAPQAPN
jgi:hypothetical protein